MSTANIAHIRTYPTGTNFPSFQGRIIKVGQYYSGQGNYGPWSFQDLEVQDESGKITVCLDKREELAPAWNGAGVAFYAGEHQGKPCGLISEDHTPKARQGGAAPSPFRRIRVTPSATMEETSQGEPPPTAPRRTAYDAAQEAQGKPAPMQRGQNQPNQRAAGPPPPPAQQQPRQETRQQEQPRQNQQAAPMTAAAAAKRVKMVVARIALIKGICYDAAAANALQVYERHGIKTSQEGVGAEAGSIFIDTMKRVPFEVFEALPFVRDTPYSGPRLETLYSVEPRPPYLLPEERAAQAQNQPNQRAAGPPPPPPAQQPQQPQQQRQPAAADPAHEEPTDGAQWGSDNGNDQGNWKDSLADDDIPF